MAITYGTRRGGDEYSRVYDRLRKRSQRMIQRYESSMADAWNAPSVQEYNRIMRLAMDEWDGFYGGTIHSAYVAGVRDALNSIGVAVGGSHG